MNISNIMKEWNIALNMEIIQLKKRETTGILIDEGKCIRHKDHTFIYWFTLSYPISLPEGGTIIYKVHQKSYSGIVISSDERECIIEFDQFLGENITFGHIVYEPWELLEKLMDRLDEAKERNGKAQRIKDVVHPLIHSQHPKGDYKNPLHEAYLRSKYNPVTFLWGPPGTGKTYTLARIAAYHYSEEKKVLLLSHSNAAVDVLIEEMHHFLTDHNRWKRGEVIRYGNSKKEYSSTINDLSVLQLLEYGDPRLAEEKHKVETYRKRLRKKLSKSHSQYDAERLSKLEVHYQKIKETFKSREGVLLKEAKVIGTTLSKAAIDPGIYEDEFDLVIVDEASMAYVPQIAFASALGKKVVICGDFKQLPPIATSYHPLVNKWLKEDIFHISHVAKSVERGTDHPQLLLLPEQRRMHPDISSFTNQYIYHSKVGDHPSIKESRQPIANLQPFAQQGAILFSLQEGTRWVGTEKGSRWNLLSSLVTIYLALIGIQNGMKSIGIVTPYRIQAKWYNLLLDELVPYSNQDLNLYASTVHGFQGSENDMIVFDVVDGARHEKPGALLTRNGSERLINVAVTRARGKFICIGDDNFLIKNTVNNKPIHQLLQFLKKQARIENSSSLFTSEKGELSKKMRWFSVHDYRKLIKDFYACKKEITINVNNIEDIPTSILEALIELQSKITVTILCKQTKILKSLSHVKVQVTTTPVPFIALDQKVLWINTVSEGHGKRFPFHIRILSKKIYQQFMKMIQE
ncbi:AAA domain-containing protein [Rossellomorea aquimaris]|uniref:AAA domain-containing protein n=1 Tax=Rossellomorea aquimaris TaxID=189382 RepID=UPI0007D0899D|nr:AAA domain-containing protein [Rossellomorea aquimaris]